jgi:hypothetical protein
VNIPQTIVALMTLASEYEEVNEEMCVRVGELVDGISRLEATVLIAELVNIQSYALTLLEERTGMSKQGFIQDLGMDIARTEEE